MLTEDDFAKFKSFRVRAMGDKLREMVSDATYDSWTFEEKVKAMIDAEDAARQSRKVAKLSKEAGFKLPGACVEDIMYVPGRSLDRDRVARWAECGWVEDRETMVVLAKSGGGKSYLVQALGNAACRRLIPTRYIRLQDMFDSLDRARACSDGARYYDLMDLYKTVDLLIIDDFLTTPIGTQDSVELFEIMEAREDRCAPLIASQLEPESWYLRIEGELMADSILNRTATRARFIDLDGPNMRKYLKEHRKDAEG